MIKVNTDEFRSAAAKLNEAADALNDVKKYYVVPMADGLGWYVREKRSIASKANDIMTDMDRICNRLNDRKAKMKKAAVMFENKETELCSRMCSEFGLSDDHVIVPQVTAGKTNSQTGGQASGGQTSSGKASSSQASSSKKSSSQTSTVNAANNKRQSGLNGILDKIRGVLGKCTTIGGARGQKWFDKLGFGKLFR